MKNPLITIIVAVFNGSETIQRCIDSVICQNYPRKEIIIKDGGSNDGTLEILKNNDDKITYWESRPDRGIAHAWNKAFKRAKGEWICFLGADDRLAGDDVLERFIPYLKNASSKNIRIVYGKVARTNSRRRTLKTVGRPWSEISWLMKHGMAIPHPGLMHHSSLFRDHGLFDESYHIALDYEFLLRELPKRKALFAKDILAVYQQCGGISDGSPLGAVWETNRARRKHNIRTFLPIWSLVAIRAGLRHFLRRFSSKHSR
jgi:glycosyltransferase involved in cell wall biosynthesis